MLQLRYPIFTAQAFALILTLGAGCSGIPPTYYIANSGSDSNNGLSPATAWRTITHVNAQTGLPTGSKILFNGGQEFTGGVILTTSVIAANVVIGSYGKGQAIISSGSSTACVTATNVPGVTVTNIVCAGGGNTSNTTDGITIINSHATGTMLAGPTITNNTVRGYGGNGISVLGMASTSGFSGVTISGNTVHDVTGNYSGGGTSCITILSVPNINVRTVHSNVIVSSNIVYNCTGDASSTKNWSGSGITVFETNGAIVERNVAHDFGVNNTSCGGAGGMWIDTATNITIQYNEAYNGKTNAGRGGCDGGGFDLDGGVTNSILQYNWSHDNIGQGYLIDEYDGAQAWNNNIVRFNISQNNEGGELVFANNAGTTMSGCAIYNNTFFNDKASSAVVAMDAGKTGMITCQISNNIFYGLGTSNYVVFVMTPSDLSFTGNDYFYGRGTTSGISWGSRTYSTFAAWQIATGQEMIKGANVGYTVEPRLVVYGGGGVTGGYVPESLNEYQLQSGSPMIGAWAQPAVAVRLYASTDRLLRCNNRCVGASGRRRTAGNLDQRND